METRFEQLDIAMKMELWQEAFKSVDDINQMMSLSEKTPKPAMLSMFYSKLARVFWKSNDHVFHACALQKVFLINSQHKKTFSVEARELASRVLLATLAVPVKPVINHLVTRPTNNRGKNNVQSAINVDQMSTKEARLAALLDITAVPTRDGLIQDMMAMGVMQYVNPELKDLYSWLEQQYHPLQLCSKVGLA